MDLGLAAVFAAGLGSVPATLGAMGTKRANKKLKTANGATAAELIEGLVWVQAVVAQDLTQAKEKVEGVANDLKVTEEKREEDRRAIELQSAVITSHLGDDKKFQEAAERFWAPLVPLLATLAPKVEGN